ncbi:ribosomal protein S18-alanine N-acetyltransferase [Desulfovibrio sp. OttesenSCG-928-O18]|nr:ribosomal protein S18-alanine N-acetyltransferase [Desulfovibrio sp. OttesenSCG-928-O18]
MSASVPVYRRLTEEDLGAVAALEAVSFPTPWTAQQYEAVMRHGGCVLFGALLESTLAGYIAVAMQPATNEMEVYNIAVAAELRCKGIGKKLLRLTLEAAARNDISRAILEVRRSNVPAIALYRSLGFEQVGERKGYYHDTGEDALVLARPLP